MNKSKLFTFKNGLIAVIVVYIISLLTKKPTVLNKEQILTEINNAENQVNQVNQVQPSENLQLSIGQNIQPKTTEIPSSLISINPINEDLLFMNQNQIV